MKLARRRLGTTDVQVTPIGFGGAAIGNLYVPVSDADAESAIGAALGAGLRLFDTAPFYGFGLSEKRLGAALADADDVVISTKVGRLLEPVADPARDRFNFIDAEPFDAVFDYSYDAVMRAFEESRRRLRRERIDVLLAHDLGPVTHGDEHPRRFGEFMDGGYRAMRELRDAGVVGAIGLGANEWEICEAALAAGEFDTFLLAGRYTLLEQTALDSFLPACAAKGVSVIVGGPFNSGILVNGVSGGGPQHYNYEAAPPEVVARVARLEAACARWGVPLPAAALRFPLLHPQVAAVIPGLADAAQVAQAIAWADQIIPEGFWPALVAEGLVRADAPLETPA